ncbi:Major Facilitator Superfamily protein [Formivibrio citricus]|uniref:Major Facilitator Superfamily protein n=1 Tax=Formivibrio citricus TaxID=83765 RepID=A0A1I5BXD2_9NEIS|nr:lysophospholipid transporter LplT [Formivibrio citricus]SFN79347.1 Major Facilitator Superfamily protein [Formivibrio citricus]
MNLGFFIILGSQFLSALADNALFIAALALLKVNHAPEWHLSMLLWCFTVSYVVLAPFAGTFADSMHKGQAMMICNGIKLAGCLGMLIGAPPIVAYALVGFGAAAYSPAKYGIITEYLPHEKLVAANGWLEGATVGAIIFGTLLGGFLSGQWVEGLLQAHSIGNHTLRHYFSAPEFAIGIIVIVYLLAAWLNLYIPKLNVRLKALHLSPHHLIKEFWWCVKRLWRDPQGGLSLAVTTLFWGAGATMRLVVINWAIIWLAYSMEQATRLVAIVAFGVAFGAVVAGKWIPLKKAFSVLPAGIAMGFVIITMLFVRELWLAASLMFFVGWLSGFFVVPLNAMLQHRGCMLMGAGHSIAVQNFNENLGILLMVGAHAMLVKYLSTPVDPLTMPQVVIDKFTASGLPPMHTIIIGFGLFVALSMVYITRLYKDGVRKGIMHD